MQRNPGYYTENYVKSRQFARRDTRQIRGQRKESYDSLQMLRAKVEQSKTPQVQEWMEVLSVFKKDSESPVLAGHDGVAQ